jgi:hypothetical protein
VASFGNKREPPRHNVLKRDAGKRFICEGNGPGRGRDDAGDGREERCLAGTVRSDDADDFALAYPKIDAAHGSDGAIAHDQAGNLEQRQAYAHCSVSGPR